MHIFKSYIQIICIICTKILFIAVEDTAIKMDYIEL